MHLYLFNPDADLALCDNGNNYLPPANIRRMARDLALLPVWYAEGGRDTVVLLPGDADDSYIAHVQHHLQELQRLFGIEAVWMREGALSGVASLHRLLPWGWNRTLRRRLLLGGIPSRLLPTVEQLEARRTLTSRACTAGILAHFRTLNLPQVGGEAKLVRALADIEKECVMQSPFTVMQSEAKHLLPPFLLKSLWSGSGKGLYWCRHGFSPDARDWAARVLRRDGALMLEPIYNKVYDFAMEFYADGSGAVSFVGYSRFLTNERGTYQGNLLAPDEEIESWLARFVPLDTLHTVRQTLCGQLSRLCGTAYTGYLGVDMMLYTPDSTFFLLHPCVEVNFRMNMGLVAHTFCRRYLAGGSRADYRVESFPSSELLCRRHDEDSLKYPLEISDGRLVSGYFSLTPITQSSTYRVSVIAHRALQ